MKIQFRYEYAKTALLLSTALLFNMIVVPAFAANKLQEAYAHYQAHRFKEATGAFDEYLLTNPRDANAMYYDALCNQQQAICRGLKPYIVKSCKRAPEARSHHMPNLFW